MSEKVWFLTNCAFGERPNAEQLAKLESRYLSRKFSRNRPIYPATQHEDSVLLLASGRAAICQVTPPGRIAILACVEPGEESGARTRLAPGNDKYTKAVEKFNDVLDPEEMNCLTQQQAELAVGITQQTGLRRQRIGRRLQNFLTVASLVGQLDRDPPLAPQASWQTCHKPHHPPGSMQPPPPTVVHPAGRWHTRSYWQPAKEAQRPRRLDLYKERRSQPWARRFPQSGRPQRGGSGAA